MHSKRALRLGFRQISGFSEDDGKRIEETRGAGFDSIRDLWLRTGSNPPRWSASRRRTRSARSGSTGARRSWAIRALRRAGDKDDLPLFARATMDELEPDAHLPPMPPGQQVVEDYRHLHLSLKAHPVSFLRGESRRGAAFCRNEQLPGLPSGRRVTVGGLVLVRQRPGTANGVIFATLEDETAGANVIIWPAIFEKFRPAILGARLVAVTGKLQNASGVIHVVADEIERSDASVCDCFRRKAPRSTPPHRPTKAGARSRCVSAIRAWATRSSPRSRRKPLWPKNSAPAATRTTVMPKGRNFH